MSRFRTILADPPWQYQHSRTKNRAIENQYATMTVEDICNMPVSDVTTSDAILLLWCTWPKLSEGVRVVEAWGFKQVSGFPWIKMQGAGTPRIGMGYYTRSVSEFVIVATRGVGRQPDPSERLPGVIFCPVGKHSRKPDEQYVFAEKYGGPYLEIFGRPNGGGLLPERDGWTRIGNEITGRDIVDDLKILASGSE